MDFELWYLAAVPLLFGAGWWLRGVDGRQRKEETHGLDDNYFKGLSLLLSDKPDKAIDHFMEVVRLDPETVDLHHALGNLFRFRGQFDQAIRIHENLVKRGELSESERMLALSELAQDFLKAGMYDRAQAAYEMLAQSKDRKLEALDALMHIFCTERDWVKAAETAETLEKDFGRDLSHEISHYWCERAELARKSGDIARAREFLKKALTVKSDNVRALALTADVALSEGKTDEALAAWKRIEDDNPRYLSLIAAKKADVLAVRNRGVALAFLKKAFAETGSVDILAATVNRLDNWEGPAAAGAFAVAALKQKPSLSAFSVLCAMRRKENPESEEAALLADITAKQAKKLGRYQCRHCGFLAHTFLWQCPGCETWDAFPPQRIEES